MPSLGPRRPKLDGGPVSPWRTHGLSGAPTAPLPVPLESFFASHLPHVTQSHPLDLGRAVPRRSDGLPVNSPLCWPVLPPPRHSPTHRHLPALGDEVALATREGVSE